MSALKSFQATLKLKHHTFQNKDRKGSIQVIARVPLFTFSSLLQRKWKLGCSANCSRTSRLCEKTKVQVVNSTTALQRDIKLVNLDLDLNQRDSAQCLIPFKLTNLDQTPFINLFKEHGFGKVSSILLFISNIFFNV